MQYAWHNLVTILSIAFTKMLVIRYRVRHAFDRSKSWNACSNPFAVQVRARFCVLVLLYVGRGCDGSIHRLMQRTVCLQDPHFQNLVLN
jgi:hypothetical protein